MLVSDVLTPVRALLRDKSDQQSQEWTDAELFVYLEQAVRDCQRDLSLIDDKLFVTTQTLAIVAGTGEYALSADTRKIIIVERMDTTPPSEIDSIEWNEVSDYENSGSGVDANTLRYLLFGKQAVRYMRFVPCPQAVITGGIRVTYEQDVVASGYTATGNTVYMPRWCLWLLATTTASYASLQNERSPGPLWDMREYERKRLRADMSNIVTGKPRQVQQPYDPY